MFVLSLTPQINHPSSRIQVQLLLQASAFVYIPSPVRVHFTYLYIYNKNYRVYKEAEPLSGKSDVMVVRYIVSLEIYRVG